MNIYYRKILWKALLLAGALVIVAFSLWYTNNLVDRLSKEEEKKVKLIAQAWKNLADPDALDNDLSFLLEVLKNNTTVPVILTDESGEILTWRNLDSAKVEHNSNFLKEIIEEMKVENEVIIVPVSDGNKQFIYYKNSILIEALSWYPYIQLSIIGIFILIAYFAFSSSRNAEQNQVWVGMSKEAAHQLGTPLSSLYGWLEYLKMKELEPDAAEEIHKDLNRLNTITERFSKIGSVPKLSPINANQWFHENMQYLERRVSKNVVFNVSTKVPNQVEISASETLLNWVLENIIKNAVDAMEGKGYLTIEMELTSDKVQIDISDTGKGMSKREFKQVFKPGFTTKKRGWGLGLSLVKRIVEEYHHGKVYVKSSEPGQGTTFRVELPVSDV
jgi:signal transduction histidine kinase